MVAMSFKNKDYVYLPKGALEVLLCWWYTVFRCWNQWRVIHMCRRYSEPELTSTKTYTTKLRQNYLECGGLHLHRDPLR